MDIGTLMQLDSTPLSDIAFTTNIGIAPEDIIKYAHLANYASIEELLPNHKDFKVIFLEWEKHKTGHWVCIMNVRGKYEYFNSYGFSYDNDLNVLSRCMKIILGEDVRQISRLLGKNKCASSKFKMQSKTSESCGRYVISRIQCLQMDYTNDEYHDFLKDTCKKYELSYDLAVCYLVPIPRIKK